eukprot:13694034-Alexandrium_andersonii.AAC.1
MCIRDRANGARLAEAAPPATARAPTRLLHEPDALGEVARDGLAEILRVARERSRPELPVLVPASGHRVP